MSIQVASPLLFGMLKALNGLQAQSCAALPALDGGEEGDVNTHVLSSTAEQRVEQPAGETTALRSSFLLHNSRKDLRGINIKEKTKRRGIGSLGDVRSILGSQRSRQALEPHPSSPPDPAPSLQGLTLEAEWEGGTGSVSPLAQPGRPRVVREACGL